ncbi:gluconate:H+ symporter [Microbacterium soli]|uniref:Gluconate:H+ symporter n=1 Tax=Microbacterium soli TaxID=446075 RepID=A0ABP7NDL8_9MICO
MNALSAPTPVIHGVLAAATTPAAGTPQLITAAVVSIALIIVLIVWVKMHPFFALMLGAAVMAVTADMGFENAFGSFSKGLGETVGGVGVLIVLGAVIGRFLTESGGADEIVDTILAKTPLQRLGWAMALAAFIVGIPLFFEVGVVLLIPIVMLAAKRARLPVVLIGIPALAGLSALHGFVPPHPGPLIAIDALHADLGLTLGLGLLVAVPAVAVAGPLISKPMARWVPVMASDTLLAPVGEREQGRRPAFGVALSVVLLPVVLMLLMTVVKSVGLVGSPIGQILIWIGTPLQALLITSLYAMIVLGTALGRSMGEVAKITGESFAPIASILLIVGAGGGFKQTLVDSGVGEVIGNGIAGSGMPLLLAGWIVAVLIRLATGSATVATITAAGIMAPLVGDLSSTHVALMVLVIGAGSVFLSHVNDAGFWLVKEYFGLTVGQTFKTWSLMECAVSVVGLVGALVLGLII